MRESVPRGLLLVAITVFLLCATPLPPASAIAAAVPLVLRHPFNPQRKCGTLVGLAGAVMFAFLNLSEHVGLELVITLLVAGAIWIRRSRLRPAAAARTRARHLPDTPTSVWASARQALRLDLSDVWHRSPDAPNASDLIHDYILPPLAGAATPLHIVPAYVLARSFVVKLLCSSSARLAPRVAAIGIIGNDIGAGLALLLSNALGALLFAASYNPALTAFVFALFLAYLWVFRPDSFSRLDSIARFLAVLVTCVGCVIFLGLVYIARGVVDRAVATPAVDIMTTSALLTSSSPTEWLVMAASTMLRYVSGETFLRVGMSLVGATGSAIIPRIM